VTDEGRVKKLINEYLDSIGCIPAGKAVNATAEHVGWYWMPVPGGYGVSFLDYVGHLKGRFFSVEAKKDDKTEPKALQKQQIKAVRTTGGISFVVGSPETLQPFKAWCEKILQED